MSATENAPRYQHIHIFVQKYGDGYYGEIEFTHDGTEYFYTPPTTQRLDDCIKALQTFRAEIMELQPECGHPLTAIVSSDEETHYCSMCQ